MISNNKVTYEEFKFKIMDRLQADIPDPKSISVQPVIRNNGLELDGLVVMESGRNIAPTIYLNPYFEEYKSGGTFSEIYSKILSAYKKSRPDEDMDISFFTDYEEARKRIAYKLVHRTRNEKLLEEIPYIPFLDLAIVFYCLIDVDRRHGSATILIRNSHLDYWNITAAKLFETAQKNTPRLLHQSLRDIQDVIMDMTRYMPLSSPLPRDAFVRERGEPSMYILSNQENLYGASCLLYQGLLAQFSRQLDTDFYILPSSIHEVILVPTSSCKDMQKMSDMVESVNTTTLMPEEILSDHAYYYSREKDEILM